MASCPRVVLAPLCQNRISQQMSGDNDRCRLKTGGECIGVCCLRHTDDTRLQEIVGRLEIDATVTHTLQKGCKRSSLVRTLSHLLLENNRVTQIVPHVKHCNAFGSLFFGSHGHVKRCSSHWPKLP